MRWSAALVLVLAAAAAGGAIAGAAQPLPSEAAHRQAAEQDATAELALLELPAGAVRSDTNPASEASWLEHPGTGTPASPNLVDQHEFWRVPGQPQAVLRWIKAHPPTGGRIFVEGSGGKPGAPPVWSVSFAQRPLRNILDERQLSVTVTAADGGGTALRADGVAVWVVPRLPSERIPAGARLLDLVVRGPKHELTNRFWIRDPARIATVARMINRLPLTQPGVRLCPLDRGIRAYLTFRSRTASLAHATAELGGCGGVRLAIGSQPQPPLDGYGLLDDLEAALGVDINLGRFSGFPAQPAMPVAPVASGTMPGGGPFRAVAYRDPRLGVCVELFQSGVRRGFGCLPHPHGRRSASLTALSCYPRAVSVFGVLGGSGARGARAVFEDGLPLRGHTYHMAHRSIRTSVGLRNDELVRLPHPEAVPLNYRGPFILAFRRGVHDVNRISVLGLRGAVIQRLRLAYGLFARC